LFTVALGTFPTSRRCLHRRLPQRSLPLAGAFSASGRSALEAVEASIITLEDHPAFDAATVLISIAMAKSNATPLSWTEPAFAPAPQRVCIA